MQQTEAIHHIYFHMVCYSKTTTAVVIVEVYYMNFSTIFHHKSHKYCEKYSLQDHHIHLTLALHSYIPRPHNMLYILFIIVILNSMFCHHNFVCCIIPVDLLSSMLNAHTFSLVKAMLHCYTIFHTFQDLFEHIFVHNYVNCKIFFHFLPTLCNKTSPPLLFGFMYLISGLSLFFFTSIPNLIIKLSSKLFHCKKGGVAVYGYANWHICP